MRICRILNNSMPSFYASCAPDQGKFYIYREYLVSKRRVSGRGDLLETVVS